MPRFDYVLVGGGLQNGLLVLALHEHQPDATVALIERADRLAGNHTWCFHDGDVPPSARGWLAPLVRYRWSGYRVLFPTDTHQIDEAYSGVSSDQMDRVVTSVLAARPGCRLILGCAAVDVGSDSVTLDTGEVVEGTVVVDARGLAAGSAVKSDGAPDTPRSSAGYQKFLGLEIDLEEPHDLDMPIVMDADVDQTFGYRFVYVLPLGERRLLVEDTYFHDSPELDPDSVRFEIEKYVGDRGWRIAEVCRVEKGVLPMPWSQRIEPPGDGPLLGGYLGGWFHPGTGYSFPVALRLAEFVANRKPEALFGPALDRFAREHRQQAQFPRFLNRLLFRWYPPSQRRHIFERVYRLPRQTISNFYALRLSWPDRIRLLVGRPPRGLSFRHRFGVRRAS